MSIVVTAICYYVCYYELLFIMSIVVYYEYCCLHEYCCLLCILYVMSIVVYCTCTATC